MNSPNFFPPYFSREVLVRPKTCWSSFSKKIENLLSHSPSRFWDCCLIKRGVQLLLLPGINCFVLDSQLGLKKAWSKEVPLVPAFLMTATDRISKILFSYSIYNILANSLHFFFTVMKRWKFQNHCNHCNESSEFTKRKKLQFQLFLWVLLKTNFLYFNK